MNSDVRKIEGVFHAPARKRKIILVNGTPVFGMPYVSLYCVNKIFLFPIKHRDADKEQYDDDDCAVSE